MSAFMRKVYNGFDTGSDIEPAAWREALRLMNEATVDGLSRSDVPPTHEEEFYRELKHSNEVFAAFKVHSMGEKMAAKLTTPDGKLKSFRQWAEDVRGISSHYVGSWLRTEYDTAVLRAHAAADWRLFERDKDIMPNLRWMPTTSPEPESTHRLYWQKKLTLPVDHPFWEKHHPGDRWNCKCMLEQTDEPANPEVLEDVEEIKPQRGLENNPGKDGHTFNDTHPYFPAKCSQCFAYKKSGFKNRMKHLFANKTKDCYNCPYIDGCITGMNKVEQKALANIKKIKEGINQFDGTIVRNKSFYYGSIRVLRRSLEDIFEHAKEDIHVTKWLMNFRLKKINGWIYEGWAHNRPYSSDHPRFNPNNPNKKKHEETDFFLYYSLNIDGIKYWANVKMHKYLKGEVLYTIEKNKPDDLILGDPPKKR